MNGTSPIDDTIVGSRVIEIAYTSNPVGNPPGNNVSLGQARLNLNGSSRVIEIQYTSQP